MIHRARLAEGKSRMSWRSHAHRFLRLPWLRLSRTKTQVAHTRQHHRAAQVQHWFERDTLPWIQELVQPLLAGPPLPLTNTRPPKDLADPDSLFTEVNGIDLHYKEVTHGLPQQGVTGKQAAPAILFLHGFNGSTFNWRLVGSGLAETVAGHTGASCRAVSYDRPPFGLSGRPLQWQDASTDPYSLEGGVALARGLIQQLGLGRVVLVGHSAGARIAMELAGRYPELVHGLVLVAPAIMGMGGYKGSLSFMRSHLSKVLSIAYMRAMLWTTGPALHFVRREAHKRKQRVLQGKLGFFADDGAARQEVINGYLRPLLAHDWDHGLLLALRTLSLRPPSSWTSVQAPVLVVQGAKDTAVPPAVGQSVADALRRVRSQRGDSAPVDYVEIADCDHLPMEEKPDEFMRIVSNWVNVTCGQASAEAAVPAVAQSETQTIPAKLHTASLLQTVNLLVHA